MSKVIKFKRQQLVNFTNHRSLTFNYNVLTHLTGSNGKGKTSIGTAPVWTLYGTDLSGAKFDPTPTNYAYDKVSASLLLSADGTDILLHREIDEKGKNVFAINDVPKKAKEYDAFVASLFDKELFLSLYNPGYFFAQHWTKQREQIMRNVMAPSNAEVFAEMSRTSADQSQKDIKHNPQATKLAELLKKDSIADLQAKHTKNKNDKDMAHTQAQGSVKTLNEQIQAASGTDVDIAVYKADIAEIDKRVATIEAVINKSRESNALYVSLTNNVKSLQEQITASAQRWPELKEEPIKDTCRTCEQSLPAAAKQSVIADKDKRIATYKANHAALVDKRKKAEAELAELTFVDAAEQWVQIKALEDAKRPVQDAIRTQEQKAALADRLVIAKKTEAEALQSKNDSIFILDAIKAFSATEAALQVGKVQALFTRLTVRLFDEVASTGEQKPFFTIQMDGKDFAKLSTGERIAAGLELTDVLFKQSELIVPCFIDGIGEYTGEFAVYDQLITGRAVKGEPLKINGEEVFK